MPPDAAADGYNLCKTSMPRGFVVPGLQTLRRARNRSPGERSEQAKREARTRRANRNPMEVRDEKIRILTLMVACGLASIVTGSLMAQKASTGVTLNDAQGQSVGTATLSPERQAEYRLRSISRICRPANMPSTFIKWRNAMSRHSNPRVRISILMASNMGCRTRKDHTLAT